MFTIVSNWFILQWDPQDQRFLWQPPRGKPYTSCPRSGKAPDRKSSSQCVFSVCRGSQSCGPQCKVKWTVRRQHRHPVRVGNTFIPGSLLFGFPTLWRSTVWTFTALYQWQSIFPALWSSTHKAGMCVLSLYALILQLGDKGTDNTARLFALGSQAVSIPRKICRCCSWNLDRCFWKLESRRVCGSIIDLWRARCCYNLSNQNKCY